MKYTDAIARADELRLNTLSDEQKTRWLYELDCTVAEMIEKPIPVWEFPTKRELLMPSPHEDVYVKYLVAMIDYYNGEAALYSNDLEIYNQSMSEARAWWIRNNCPRSSGNWRV